MSGFFFDFWSSFKIQGLTFRLLVFSQSLLHITLTLNGGAGDERIPRGDFVSWTFLTFGTSETFFLPFWLLKLDQKSKKKRARRRSSDRSQHETFWLWLNETFWPFTFGQVSRYTTVTPSLPILPLCLWLFFLHKKKEKKCAIRCTIPREFLQKKKVCYPLHDPPWIFAEKKSVLSAA